MPVAVAGQAECEGSEENTPQLAAIRARTMPIRGRYGNGHVLVIHGSMRSTPVSWKSRVSRVATAMRRERAIVVIWPSNWASGCPDRRRVATIAA